MLKDEVYQQELEKWNELFSETDEHTQKAASGLIQKAAFIHSMCHQLEEIINLSGSLKVHPRNPELQKNVPAVKEYDRQAEAYANIVNKLNAMRLKSTMEEDDDLEEYED